MLKEEYLIDGVFAFLISFLVRIWKNYPRKGENAKPMQKKRINIP